MPRFEGLYDLARLDRAQGDWRQVGSLFHVCGEAALRLDNGQVSDHRSLIVVLPQQQIS